MVLFKNLITNERFTGVLNLFKSFLYVISLDKYHYLDLFLLTNRNPESIFALIKKGEK